jgi:4-hydroxy-tetrahydrodipicolinate reductase
MNVLVLGKEKTGALIAQIACDRGHTVRVLNSHESMSASGLLNGSLSSLDVVMDFTSADAVLANICAYARAGINMLVGSTGWYSELARVREEVEHAGIGLIYGANFALALGSVLDAIEPAPFANPNARSGSLASRFNPRGAWPAGFSLSPQMLQERHGLKLDVTAVRKRETVGQQTLAFDCGSDSFLVTHDARSQRSTAEGALRAAEWLRGKHGLYDLNSICRRHPAAGA